MPGKMRSKKIIVLSIFFFVVMKLSVAQVKTDSEALQAFEFRNTGAYRAGAWISAIAVPEHPGEKYKHCYFVSGRNGGVWKTINNGTTFYPVFEKYGVTTIGVISISPSNPDIVWVGTGESSSTRVSCAGNGIYKSTDGGETFMNMGLKESEHISAIVINPVNPDIVYVAVMGNLYSTNEQRGIYKTTDGGKTWEKIFYIDDKTGFIELLMSFQNPDILFASAYEKTRLPWHLEAGGKNSAAYKTSDGGKKWEKLGNGLPSGELGRIGLAIYRRNSDIIYALVENLNPKDPSKPIATDNMTNTNRDNYYDQLKGGELYRSMDGGTSWEKMNDSKDNLSGKAAYSFNKVFVNPVDEKNVWSLSDRMQISYDYGKSWTGFGNDSSGLLANTFGDFRTLWMDPNDGKHVIICSDGGLFETFDAGKTTRHLYNIPVEELYSVSYDFLKPYNLYVCLQDHDVWRGPSNGWEGEVGPEDWTVVGSGDGMYCQADKETGRWIYSTGQFGQHMLLDAWTGNVKHIMPKAPKGKPRYRFTWTTPLSLSPHNSNIIYTGAQMMLRSANQGKDWEEISPDLTTNDPVKQNGRGHIQYCTITSFNESPVRPGIIWAGTDDGRIQVTFNDGKNWADCTHALTNAGCPENFWTTRVFASNYETGTAYITKSGYTRDDFRPFIYKTTDSGKTWRSISNNLPNQPVNVIWEDKDNKHLLFAGTDGGLYISVTDGREWIKFSGIPSVPVKDVVVHPRENDLIVATFGRGVYITNIAPLKEISADLFKKEAAILPVQSKPSMNYSAAAFIGNRRLQGDTHLFTLNEPHRFEIWYYINPLSKRNTSGQPVYTMEIYDTTGSLIKSLDVKKTGLGKVYWEFGKQIPGKYTVKLKSDNRDNKETTRVIEITEPLHWPIGNYDMQREK